MMSGEKQKKPRKRTIIPKSSAQRQKAYRERMKHLEYYREKNKQKSRDYREKRKIEETEEEIAERRRIQRERARQYRARRKGQPEEIPYAHESEDSLEVVLLNHMKCELLEQEPPINSVFIAEESTLLNCIENNSAETHENPTFNEIKPCSVIIEPVSFAMESKSVSPTIKQIDEPELSTKVENSYMKMCRFCLEEPEGKCNSLLHRKIKKELHEAFSDLVLDETKNISQLVCQDCMTVIHEIKDFKQRIIKNQEFLLSLLKQNTENQENSVYLEEFINVKEEIIEEEENKVQLAPKKRRHEDLVEEESEPETRRSRRIKSIPMKEKPGRTTKKSKTDTDEEEKPSDEDFDDDLDSDFKGSDNDSSSEVKYNLNYSKKEKVEVPTDKIPLPPLLCEEDSNAVWCPICEKIFENKAYLQQHGKRMHPEYHWNLRRNPKTEKRTKVFKCDRCKKVFNTQRFLNIHKKQKHFLQMHPLTCDLCIVGDFSGRFENENILEIHKKKHQVTEINRIKRPFPCTACELRFHTEKVLNQHKKSHKTNALHSCQVCGVTVKGINEHMRKHQECKLVCYLCGNTCASKYNMAYHMKLHLERDSANDQCDKCGKRFQRLQRHMMRCTGPRTEWPCNYCDQVFETSNQKYRHAWEFHNNFRCKRCDVTFDRYYAWKLHRKTFEHKSKRVHKMTEKKDKNEVHDDTGITQ